MKAAASKKAAAPAKKRAAAASKKVATPAKKPAAAASKKVAAPAKKPAAAAKKSAGGKPATKRPAVKTALTSAERKSAVPNALTTFRKLREIHPDAHCELDHRTPFELLVATVLSAQTTDKLVNKVTPHLFAKYPDAKTLGAAEAAEVATLLGSQGLGMYNQKAKNIVGLARLLVQKHGGEVPRALAALIELPGVGRKTANVVLGVAFGVPEGVVVDTHVMRIAQRLGWTKNADPPEIEADLCRIFPKEDWDMLSHTLIFHGRRVCAAVKPACASCGVADVCPSAYQAVQIGRKPPRVRT